MVCGFLNLADIGSPMSLSRHLILPNESPSVARVPGSTDAEKLEADIAAFYSKADDEETTEHKSIEESACVLLHGALKFDNLAAVVLLNDDWFGFMHSYSDSKRKSNIILTILPPGKCNKLIKIRQLNTRVKIESIFFVFVFIQKQVMTIFRGWEIFVSLPQPMKRYPVKMHNFQLNQKNEVIHRIVWFGLNKPVYNLIYRNC